MLGIVVVVVVVDSKHLSFAAALAPHRAPLHLPVAPHVK
jgi:hypothetical protein